MTAEEAIESLQGCIVSEEYENGKANGNVTCDLTREIINMAISALEKQIAKKPEYSSDGYSPEGLEVWDAYCPNCGHELEEEDICPNCGQAICREE